MNRTLKLLLIDPQNSFCDLPPEYLPRRADGGVEAPTLAVPGAHADMQRVARLIQAAGARLADIVVTLDTHNRMDIAHNVFWVDGQGAPVQPFTLVSLAKVESGEITTREPANLPRAIAYLRALEARGRMHILWPVHCEIGTWGNNVHADVQAAYSQWEEVTGRSVQKVVKGMNPWTEHFSAVRAEVPDEDDPDTLTNQALIDSFKAADVVYIAGEAGSHCVAETVRHIAEGFGDAPLGKFVLITDGISPVPGFETAQTAFFSEMRDRGMRFATAVEAEQEIAG